MAKFFSIGEALIDMIPSETGVDLKAVSAFKRTAGGAPANVCACVARQGVDASFIGKLGDDAFGDYLVETIESAGVDVDKIFRTNEANTTLAFVSLKADGERDFSFYRKPGADMLLCESEVNVDWFSKSDFLHFCSVDLIEAPVKYAHKKAIEGIKLKGGNVVFDPNLRFPLWDDKEELKATVLEFANYADIIKISDNELEFICGTENVIDAAKLMFEKGVKLFIYTMGSEGSRVITKDIDVFVPAFKVKAIDTTGSGDAFIGAFISQIINKKVKVSDFSKEMAKEILEYANACGAIIAAKHGAISLMPNFKEVSEFLKKH